MKKFAYFFILLLTLSSFTGCSTFQKANQYDALSLQVDTLRRNLSQAQKDRDKEVARLLAEKKDAIARLNEEKDNLSKLLLQEKENNSALSLKLSQKEQKLDATIARMEETVKRLEEEKAKSVAQLTKEKKAEVSALEEAKQRLAQSLQQELSEYKAKLEMTERGLILTFLAEIFFDPGKAELRNDAKATLKKVGAVLNKEALASNIAIEGHTDSDPITHSSWQSNWELSSARALAVLHYFIDEGLVTPKRLSAVGYGEFRPVASNDTPAGKQQNRRVEIVILPAHLEKVKK